MRAILGTLNQIIISDKDIQETHSKFDYRKTIKAGWEAPRFVSSTQEVTFLLTSPSWERLDEGEEVDPPVQ